MHCLASKYSIFAGLGVFTLVGAIGTTINPQAQAESRQGGGDAIKLIIRAQQAYHLENNTFASSFSQLNIRLQPKNYTFVIAKATANDVIVIALPVAGIAGLRSYAGGAFQRGEQFSAIVCESNRPTQTVIAQPFVQNGRWICGQDSHPFNGSVEAISSIGTVLRAQQAYRLENNTFATRISQLDVRLAPTAYYRYGIVEADTKHAIAKAIPTVSGLNSVAGAALQRGDDYLQIICESNRPSQGIASPFLSQGKWVCGPDSHAVQ